VLAAVDELHADTVADMLMNAIRNRHATGVGKPFKAGGNIDSVSKEIVAIHHDVSEIDAYADHNLPTLQSSVRGGHGLLNRGGAFDRVDCAAELDEDTIASVFEDAALMAHDEWVNDVSAPRLQLFQRA
jgi:hypothetical protein